MKSIKKSLSTTQIIALGFFVAILIGTALLMLPVSSADGRVTPLIDSLFTATTSICVTGLVVVPTYLHWSAFGKVVILLLIQLGGLGIISFTTGIMMVIGRRITLHDRILLEDALNLNTLSGLVAFLRKIFCGTFIIEGIGALGYTFLFIPKYGLLRGIWYSIFHSVSAFCNAGIDLLGNSSLCNYLTNTWMNIVTMFLIISGGIGFIVWLDLLDAFKNLIKKKKAFSYIVKKLPIHTKLVLITTFILLFGGMLLILLFEYDNTATIGNLDFYHKILASLFQSVTTRTAGFLTISQSSLRPHTALICMFLMFIGGSSIGTAGGIKTTTFALLVLNTIMIVKGQNHVTVFHKTIPHKTHQKAIAVTLVSFMVLGVAIITMSCFETGSLMDIAYEVTSAIATVGLTRDFTPHLHLIGKTIIIICMYLGRIGPLSLAILFNNNTKRSLIAYPHEDVTVG